MVHPAMVLDLTLGDLEGQIHDPGLDKFEHPVFTKLGLPLENIHG